MFNLVTFNGLLLWSIDEWDMRMTTMNEKHLERQQEWEGGTMYMCECVKSEGWIVDWPSERMLHICRYLRWVAIYRYLRW